MLPIAHYTHSPHEPKSTVALCCQPPNSTKISSLWLTAAFPKKETRACPFAIQGELSLQPRTGHHAGPGGNRKTFLLALSHSTPPASPSAWLTRPSLAAITALIPDMLSSYCLLEPSYESGVMLYRQTARRQSPHQLLGVTGTIRNAGLPSSPSSIFPSIYHCWSWVLGGYSNILVFHEADFLSLSFSAILE